MIKRSESTGEHHTQNFSGIPKGGQKAIRFIFVDSSTQVVKYYKDKSFDDNMVRLLRE